MAGICSNLLFATTNRIKMSDNEEQPAEVPQEEEKADNITDAIKSVIKKSQANDGKHQRLSS